MTSQIRSRIESLIPTYRFCVLLSHSFDSTIWLYWQTVIWFIDHTVLEFIFSFHPLFVSVNARNARVVKGMGGILHNMLYRVAAARQPIRDEDAVNIFQRFRDCKDSMIACKALILQVNLPHSMRLQMLLSCAALRTVYFCSSFSMSVSGHCCCTSLTPSDYRFSCARQMLFLTYLLTNLLTCSTCWLSSLF